MIRPTPTSDTGEPVWEIAEFFPLQGEWTQDEYVRLDTNRLVELSDGNLEVLPMPTEWHQMITLFLYEQLRNFTRTRRLGLTLAAPMRVRLWDGKMREPDVAFMLAKHSSRRGEAFWDRADLVMEVVSEDDPQRDLVLKRQEYAKAGIPEYWIVDPRDKTIRVLCLASTGESTYNQVGCYGLGQAACSALLAEFKVEVSEVFDESREY